MERLALPLRVLIAAPRPTVAEALLSRERVEALYDALEAQGHAVEAEWLWPATAEALAARLAATDRPTIGVLYLDALMRSAAEEDDILWADSPVGAPLPEGLTALLGRYPVPLVILSLVGEGAAELAGALVRAGAPHVITLDAELPLDLVRQALSALWTALVAGHAVGDAVAEARRSFELRPPALLHSVEQAIRLVQAGVDAPLVHVSPAASGVSKVIRFPSPNLLPAWQRLADEAETGGLPPEPATGFVGRTRELNLLEGYLRAEEGEPVWIYGYEGLGKTSLIVHLARWLVRTGRFEQVVYTSFLGGGLPEVALYDLGVRLLGEEFSLRQGEPIAAVEAALNKTRTLVIWDNLEGILPEGEFAIGPESWAELVQLAARFSKAGASRVCLLTDSIDLPTQGLSQRSLGLGGLAEDEALALMGRLVGASEIGGEPMSRLVRALGGHPLALGVLAPLIALRSLPEVLTDLEEMLPALYSGEARLRNQALDLALEALRRSFADDFQPSLFSLGLFIGGFMEPLGINIMRMEAAAWNECKQRLLAAQLIHEERLPRLNVPFICLNPSLSRFLWRRLSTPQLRMIQESYVGSYLGLLSWMSQNEGQSPGPMRTLARHELPNLRRGLRLLIESQTLATANDYVRYLQHFLEVFGFLGERETIGAQMQKAVEVALPKEGPLGQPGVQFLLRQAEQLVAAGHMPQALTMLQHLVQRMEQENGLSYGGEQATYDRGVAWHRVGRYLQIGGRPDLALPALMRSHELLSSLEPTEPIRREVIQLDEHLGEALLTAGEIDKAETLYNQSLALAGQLQDHRAMGTIMAQLGAIAGGRSDLAAARERFQTALGHLAVAEDAAGMAMVWDHLGGLAGRNSDLAEAERCYQQALDLAQKANQPLLQAQAWIQLAQLAAQQDQAAEAESRFLQAIRLYQEHGAKLGLVAAQVALAELLLREGQLRQAKIQAEAARVAVEEAGPDAHPWEVYSLLERIAEAEGDEDTAQYHRMRAQETFAHSPEAGRVLESWQPIIEGVARACQGEALDSETVERLEELEAKEEWRDLTAVIWRILQGERGRELYARLDYIDAAVARRILEAVEGPQASEEEASDVAAPGAQGNQGAAQAGTALRQLLSAVVAAANGNQQAQEMVSTVLANMRQDSAPDPVRRFAEVLARIVQGERDLAVLSGLPNEMAVPLRELLSQLKTRH